MNPLQDWLNRLGYSAEPSVLHLASDEVPDTHPYALEIKTLLLPEGAVNARAVFDVEGVPTVVFVGDDDMPLSATELEIIRQKIWNQNLATIVIDIRGDVATAWPACRSPDGGLTLSISEAQADGPFSAMDIVSANISRRLPGWFDVSDRVDSKLLLNLRAAVSGLARSGFSAALDAEVARRQAELMMGQILFISYLEHRDIVGATYRARRSIGRLHDLVSRGDRQGIGQLIDALRQDFNGDFLGNDRHEPWTVSNSTAFQLLDAFLSQTDLTTGQLSFWNYDFSFIPVELLSGLYESFLAPDQQEEDGAYYTPRHLAMLAVDQILATSTDPLSETVFDGACGSGILLTTTYRRLLALAEARNSRKLSFRERSELLVQRIFGGDINQMACRVTAFSLYLSLLEGLTPSDIVEAQEREQVKLPTLAGTNLCFGEAGDFFSDCHTFSNKTFSLLISNPPWKEPAGGALTTADDWTKAAKVPFARRQIAGAYALRALDFLTEGGRLCLILPIGLFLGPSSTAFVGHLLRSVEPKRLINFGDLQALLFPSAENTCHVFIAKTRAKMQAGRVPFGETFDYCVPKADISLVFGRLTMESADRHILQTMTVIQDPQILVTLMWGDVNDIAILTRLGAFGTFGDFWSAPKAKARWRTRKGVHMKDKSREAESSERLREIPHIPIGALSAPTPVLQRDLLTTWPAEATTVAHISDELMTVFDGPRVVWSDGFSRQDLMLRASYIEGPATFTNSVGVIAGSATDASLLKFAAIYLRSSLARYVLMMRAWKMLCERNAVHIADIESFPFFGPQDAPEPERALDALSRATQRLDFLAGDHEFELGDTYAPHRAAFDEDVFDYFGISPSERALIAETVDVLMPSIRPRGFKSLDTPAQRPAGPAHFGAYAEVLTEALTIWRDRTGGRGHFNISVFASDPHIAGPTGIVRVEYVPTQTTEGSAISTIDSQLVRSVLNELRLLGLATISSGNALQLVPDVHVWTGEALYMVRSLARRNWTRRQALRDSERLVRSVQDQINGSSKRPEAACS